MRQGLSVAEAAAVGHSRVGYGRAVFRPVLGPGPWDLVSSPTREFRPAGTAHNEAEPAKLRRDGQQRNEGLGWHRRGDERDGTYAAKYGESPVHQRHAGGWHA